MKRVLVPLDGSALATRILPDAQRLAGPGGEIVLMHDINRPSYDHLTHEFGTGKLSDEVKTYLEAQAQGLRQQGVKTEVQTVVLNDIPLSIDEAARIFHADLIACATHGRGPIGRLVRGGVAWRTLAHSSVPVMLRHVEEDDRSDKQVSLAPRRIMVPLDGSPLAESAMPLAATLAEEWNAQLFLVWVIPDLAPSATPYHYMYTAPADFEVEKHEAQLYLDRLTASLPQQVHTRVIRGGIADSLVATVEEFSITDIVMASHGRTGLSRVIIGSVADALVHRLTCPIIIIPALAARQRETAASPVAKETVVAQ